MAYDDSEPITTENILRRITASRAELETVCGDLTPENLARAGPEGWAIKDHLAHLAAWERSVLALLGGEDRNAAMGLPSMVGVEDSGEINDAVYELYRDEPAATVLKIAEATHLQLLATVGGMSDDDLVRPYSHYQPDDPPYNARPVYGWIVGNTFEHYDDHARQIAAVLESFET